MMAPMSAWPGSDAWLTVAEAAEILDRTPQAVRDLIAAGTLPAQRVGRAFVVSHLEVERLQRLPRPAGRPLTPAAAWELVAVLTAAGRQAGGVPPTAARRRQLCGRDVRDLAARLEVRAWRAPVTITTSRWRRLLDDEMVVPSGDRLAATTDAYVAAADLSAVRQRYALEPAGGAGAGVLRVVPTGVPAALAPRRPRAGAATAALDAIEDPDADRHAAGLAELAALQERACARLARGG